MVSCISEEITSCFLYRREKIVSTPGDKNLCFRHSEERRIHVSEILDASFISMTESDFLFYFLQYFLDFL